MNSLLPYKSCCYEWESHGDVVKEKNSGQIYGTISKDTPTDLRMKFATLILAQPIVSIFLRMPYRVYTILRGDCIRVGYKAATKEWQIQTQKWSLELDPKIPPPNRLNFCVSVGKHTFIELIKSISKLVTYPLAIIALEFSALYGLINPNSGRAMYAAVEHAWSSTQLDAVPQSGRFRHTLTYKLWDYLAPCMQPKEIWDQRNFYKDWMMKYNPQIIRSLLRQAKEMLQEKQEFYKNEGINVQELISALQQYQQNVKKVSLNNIIELHMTDNKYLSRQEQPQAYLQQIVKLSLNQMFHELNEIEQNRAARFLDQVNVWNQGGDKPKGQYFTESNQRLQDIINSLNPKFL